MRTFTSYALSISVTAALLAACGGSQPPIASGDTPVLPGTKSERLTASYKVLHRFKGGVHGSYPVTDLVNMNGTLYGAASGAYPSKGMIYSVTTSGAVKILHVFTGNPDGANPDSGLIDVNGTLYGTTYAGGSNKKICKGCGTVYSITSTGNEKVLYSFVGGSDGAHPLAGLVDMNGTLYGTTTYGGGGTCKVSGIEKGCGAIYSITTAGTEKVLATFSGGPDGQYPESALTAMKNALYGTTFQGGSSAQGTVFRVTTAGVKKVLHSFGSGTDGRNPYAALTDVQGTLYGTTQYGGQSGNGTIFSIRRTGAERVVYSFAGSPDGSDPQGGLINVSGTLYGTTDSGGTSSKPPFDQGRGTVYSVTTTGAENVLHSFTGNRDGIDPIADLVDVKGELYGTTQYGGQGNLGYGTIFELTP